MQLIKELSMISMIKVTKVKTPQKDKKGISDKGCK